MGTHPSLPSKDLQTGRSLLDLVQDNQALMTTKISDRYEQKLPFLFKVLSISKALSIQAHPNKKLAEQLHQKDPEHYPDGNHKPEMTIAITPFEGFCGFRPLNEISHFLKHVPSFRKLVGEEKAKAFEETTAGKETSTKEEDVKANKKVLKEAFSSLMKQDDEATQEASKDLVSSAEKDGEGFAGGGGPTNTCEELAELVTRLNSQFPGDKGLFVLFFLNYVKLAPGEGMFLRADDIHAYISGDIIECMASSDNVIRAGFTPKFKDVETLTSCLTYNYDGPEEQKMSPEPWPHAAFNAVAYAADSTCLLYDPPIEEFSVLLTTLMNSSQAGGRSERASCKFDPIDGPSIIICTEGEGKISVGNKSEDMKEGWVYFIGATAEVTLQTMKEKFVTFRAFC